MREITFFSFDELVQLSDTDELPPELAAKLGTALRAPLLSNEIAAGQFASEKAVRHEDYRLSDHCAMTVDLPLTKVHPATKHAPAKH